MSASGRMTDRSAEIVRPSRRTACACTLCCPFAMATVFQETVHCRPLHDVTFAPSTKRSTRAMLPTFAEPTIWTVPVAGDGTATVTDVLDSANTSDPVRTDPIKKPE